MASWIIELQTFNQKVFSPDLHDIFILHLIMCKSDTKPNMCIKIYKDNPKYRIYKDNLNICKKTINDKNYPNIQYTRISIENIRNFRYK